MAMMRAAPEFEALLQREENRIQDFTRRLFLIEAVEAELTAASRGKSFIIWNDAVWMMVLDTRDAFVIHFASWARGMYEKGGFLRQIQAHGLRDLKKKWKAGTATRDDRVLRALLAHHHDESFARLFPDIKTGFPRPENIEKARDGFASHFKGVISDRDSNRAHPYESQHAKNARMLDVRELRTLVDQAQRFLNDLRLVACKSTFAYNNMNFVPVSAVAEELVDQILIGTSVRRVIVQKTRSRSEYYDEVHARHDACSVDPKPLFNASENITARRKEHDGGPANC